MAKGRVFYTNVMDLDNADSITAFSEDTGFDVSFFYDTNQGTKLKSNGTTQNVVIDFGSAKTIKAACLLNTNLGASPTTVDFEANASDSWGSPSQSTAMTAKQNPLTANYDYYIRNISWNYQFFRFNLAVSSGVVELGLGMIFEDDYEFVKDTGIGSDFSLSIINEETINTSLSGHVYRDIITSKRSYDLGWPSIQEAQKTIFETIARQNYIVYFPKGTSGNDMIYGIMRFGNFQQVHADDATAVYYNAAASFEEAAP